MHGEILKLNLKLCNVGQQDLKNHLLALSHSTFVAVGLDQSSVGAAAEDPMGAHSKGTRIVKHGATGMRRGSLADSEDVGEIISLPDIQANQSVEIPIWLRGSSIGMHTVAFLFYYESCTEGHPLEYRLCRYSREVQVVPSLKVSD